MLLFHVVIRLEAQILPTFGDSRTGGSGMQFLKISPDARSLALGGAGVAVVNDLSAVFWNGAAIAEMDTARVHISNSSSRYIGGTGAYFGAVGGKVGQLSYLALHFFSLDYGTMKETTEFEPDGTGRQFTVANYTIGLTYSRILTNNFAFGLTGKYANESFAGVQIHNVLFDLGLKYNIGIKKARFGINFTNFGVNVSPSGSVTVLKFTGDQEVNKYTTQTVPAIFRIGAAFDPLSTPYHQMTLAGQLNHPTDNNETYSLGLEYRYLGIVAVRTGYEFKSDAAYLFPSLGMGVKLNRRVGGLTLDYAYQARTNLGSINRISIGIYLR